MRKSFGFLRIAKEVNEKRAFLPDFFKELEKFDIDIYLEFNYGFKMGFTENDYCNANKNIKFASRKEVFSMDYVIVLRTPENDELKNLKRGSVLISMLHYITRERRNLLLEELGIIPFSMDTMINDDNKRIVVNSYFTAFNGADSALNELEKKFKNKFISRTINIGIIGMGNVGLNVAKAFKDLSNKRLKEYKESYFGMRIIFLTRSITSNVELLENELKNLDIIVDASTRRDTSEFIIDNEMVGILKKDAVILDITADPYDFEKNPPQVKAIEGIPTGTLDQYVFNENDEIYNEVQKLVCTKNRRTVVTCNAWPGVYPIPSMKRYGKQMLPILNILIKKGYKDLNIKSNIYYERALYRSSYEFYKNS
ncbi:alanine dehydrogenase [Clostridiaceae bacterium HSG29]|nr:alanine dehydrogenase [Clostridiaceae bacterium HSG29]